MRKRLAMMLGLALAAAPAFAQDQPAPGVAPEPAEADSGVSLTVYSSADPAGFDPQQFIAQQRQGYNPQFVWQVPGFGVVKDVRHISFEDGLQQIAIKDVAEFIDPTTVSFADLKSPQATRVLEQQFLFDLVSPSKLLEKYVDQRITVFEERGDQVQQVEGVLLSANQGGLVLQTDQGVRIVNSSNVQLPELPGGLITRPTLQWLVDSDRAGERPVRVAYQTAGMTWRADYNLVLNEDDTAADLAAWVSLMNLSGASYDNAQLKLIAGDVQRVQPQQPRYGVRRSTMDMARSEQVGFEEKAFFEYHLYTLPRRTDVKQNSTQQLTLFPSASDVGVEKVMVYYGLPQAADWGIGAQPRTDRDLGNQSNKKVDVYVRFENSEENNLGMPMPKGKVRVFKQDTDGALEFVGEDLIDHTPRDETLLIKVGQAFDVVGERTQTNFTVDSRNRVITETFRIQLRNHKEELAEVIIKENLYRWSNWQITEHSDPFEKVDSRTIHFPVTVAPDSEKTVTYTVRYTW